MTVGHESSDLIIYVNNTGNTRILVTPTLVDSDDPIMKNVYFIYRQSSSYNYTQIGRFNFTISAPGTSGYREEHFTAVLNLTNYSSSMVSPLLDYEAQIKFVAVAY